MTYRSGVESTESEKYLASFSSVMITDNTVLPMISINSSHIVDDKYDGLYLYLCFHRFQCGF